MSDRARASAHLARARAFVVTLALIGLVAGARAHSTARGAVHLRVDESGRIAARLDVTEQEIMDLFGVDAASATDEARLAPLLETTLPRVWRFSADEGRECPHRFVRWSRRGVRTIVVESEARCQTLPATLTVDWGLSAISTLDLLAVTTVEAPDGIRHTTILSRQTPREHFVVRHPSAWTTLSRFVALGVHHIATGYDHLAFLLALLLGCASWRRLVVVVTAFTVAHSVTLALGATGLVQLPSALVESIIALSIAVAALVLLARIRRGTATTPGAPAGATRGRSVEALFALAFGLVHGLGFASMLEEALGQEPRLLLALAGFNVGVELGQLVAVAVAFPVAVVVGRTTHARTVFQGTALVVAGLGLFWTFERVFG